MAAPATAGPSSRRETGEKALTLAQAFDLLRQSLSELPSPSAGEAVRNRMAALFGKTDPLLELERFHRFLRQAHDAEVADVRMVGDNEYEVSTRPGFRYERPAQPARPAPSSGAVEPAAAPAVEAPVEAPAGNGKRAGIRFRRGARGVMARAEVAMVGVVQADEPASPKASPQAAAEPKKPGRGAKSARTRKPKTSAAAVPETNGVVEPSPAPTEAPGAARRPRRPRARKT